MTDEKPEPGEKVGNITIPSELLSDMTDKERNQIAAGQIADDVKVFRSPIDDQLTVVALFRGEEVCQYCFKRFREDDPDLRATEIFTKNPTTGEYGGTRVKVHGRCHDKAGGPDGIE